MMMIESILLAVLMPLHNSNRCYVRAAGLGSESEVQSILQRMEQDVLAFRDEIESVYSARCGAQTLTACYENNSTPMIVHQHFQTSSA